ncbi:Proline-rich nuclear receptor coactivator [Quillaja saponaria]|uniref:Proline-rich nuclear receptor coactivator n=1 Tax=Quillaja saponaria TaxID=32244 RepID=A0AAD7QDX1_QUISA|nr:Proline-rich nuclear receptor coactivator [Quillaja saponaria]
MGTAILRSEDCLRGRFRHETLALTQISTRSRRNSNPNPDSNLNTFQSRRRKRSPVAVQSNQQDRDRDRSRYGYGDRSVVDKAPSRDLVMGQVKILKRGETLSVEKNSKGLGIVEKNRKTRVNCGEDLDLVLGSIDRLGPDPETVQKQIRVSECKVVDGIYAGSAFVSSPPPSSLPVPGFLGKNGTATSDLRRLLRL